MSEASYSNLTYGILIGAAGVVGIACLLVAAVELWDGNNLVSGVFWVMISFCHAVLMWVLLGRKRGTAEDRASG